MSKAKKALVTANKTAVEHQYSSSSLSPELMMKFLYGFLVFVILLFVIVILQIISFSRKEQKLNRRHKRQQQHVNSARNQPSAVVRAITDEKRNSVVPVNSFGEFAEELTIIKPISKQNQEEMLIITQEEEQSHE